MNVHNHNIRGSNDLYITAVDKNYAKRTIKHKCSIIRNKLGLLNNFTHYRRPTLQSSMKNFTKKIKSLLAVM